MVALRTGYLQTIAHELTHEEVAAAISTVWASTTANCMATGSAQAGCDGTDIIAIDLSFQAIGTLLGVNARRVPLFHLDLAPADGAAKASQLTYRTCVRDMSRRVVLFALTEQFGAQSV